MRLSEKGLELIKHFEGCQLRAYRCQAGVLTIGWGHTGDSVKEGLEITQLQADEIFKHDMSVFERAVNDLVTIELDQNQFDALVSFAFNCGAGALKGSTLLRLLNKGKVIPACAQFSRWNKVRNDKGKLVPSAGLTRRRYAEAHLFATGENRFYAEPT